MASAFGHGYTGFMLSKILYMEKAPARLWLLAMACAILPDADALGFALGIPYASTFGHRGFTHSICFAILVGIAIPFLFFRTERKDSARFWGLAAFFFLVTLTHPLLDSLTTGGLGVAFFAPFSNERYFLPWRVIRVSPIGVTNFFRPWGLTILLSEALWIGLPLLGAYVVARVVRYRTRTTT